MSETRWTKHPLTRYGVAVLAIVLATLLRMAAAPLLKDRAPFSTYFVALMVTGWYSGLGPTLLATLLGALAAAYFFIEPHGTIYFHARAVYDLEHQVSAALYILAGVVIAVLSESLKAGQRRTEAARAKLADANRALEKEIADHTQAECWLLESEQRFRGYFEQGVVGMAMLSEQKELTEVNQRFCRMLGYKEEDLVNRNWTELVHPDDSPAEDAQFRQMLKGVIQGYAVDSRFLCKNGTILYANVAVRLMRKEGGTLDCILVLVQDITERKRLEAELASVAQFPKENPDPVLRASGDERPLFFNDAAKAWLAAEGWQQGAPLPSPLREAVESVLRTGDPGDFDLPHRDGRIFSCHCVPIPEKQYVNIYGRDVTRSRQAEEELRAAKESAERAKGAAELANRAKEYFLATLSHELRTPLAPVVMGLSMLQDRANLEQDVREMLEMIRRNAELETRLIDDLLDMTRLSRGVVDLHQQTVDLATIITYAVDVCRSDIEARGLELGVDMGSDVPYWVEADVVRLQQVFWNLLKNAIKFTPHGGCVGIRCRRDGLEHVTVEVNDSGLGIDPEALPRLFNAFEQAERSISRQFGGLGLGLAISRALVEMHGGTIAAHSEGRGKGATFRVRLPLTAPLDPSDVPHPAESQTRATRPVHILLVEDHGVMAKMMRLLLLSEGHEVQTAGDLATALDLASQHRLDLLISDLGLPDGTGYDLIRKLRSQGHRFPGIALSGYGQEDDIRRSREAGFAVICYRFLTASVTEDRTPHDGG